MHQLRLALLWFVRQDSKDWRALPPLVSQSGNHPWYVAYVRVGGAFIIHTLFAPGAGAGASALVSAAGSVGCVTFVLLCIIEQCGRSQACVSTVHSSKRLAGGPEAKLAAFGTSIHAPPVPVRCSQSTRASKSHAASAVLPRGLL
jgi:hypothetical protein